MNYYYSPLPLESSSSHSGVRTSFVSMSFSHIINHLTLFIISCEIFTLISPCCLAILLIILEVFLHKFLGPFYLSILVKPSWIISFSISSASESYYDLVLNTDLASSRSCPFLKCKTFRVGAYPVAYIAATLL